eukprot:TRINITY_DN1296_c0_g1_i15.p1 TRINITY_DN1296_c0_g1~~TRINITY_DN1296_c0_g1_i15.p1  ORF type:complete len:125 (+),score=8.24 TRINITY_DN1296_c0_g1_i15:1879-2253(+)
MLRGKTKKPKWMSLPSKQNLTLILNFFVWTLTIMTKVTPIWIIIGFINTAEASNINMSFLNVNGLSDLKSSLIHKWITDDNIKIIGISETHRINNGYKGRKGKRDRGGVALWIHEDIVGGSMDS